MTSVMESVGGSRAARAYLRSGTVCTLVIFVGLPAAGVLDDRWGRPVLSVPSLALIAVTLLVVTAHLVLVRPGGEPADRPLRALGWAALAAATGGTVLMTSASLDLGLIWFMMPGVALSALLAARGWLRQDLVVAGVAAVLAVVAAGALAFPLTAYALLGLVIALPTLADLGSVWLIAVFDRLDQARRDADELATTRERVRIAAELHDVQGHSLHAIALHAELTERLVTSDPSTAATHARTVRTLAADALAETRELVRGYRDADLAGELRNAAGLLRAAGAEARVTGDAASVPAVHAALLGPAVRESATNVLRHSHPSRVDFVVRHVGDRTELEVRNDGVSDTPTGTDAYGGTGLVGLRDRVGKRGGYVEAGPDDPDGWRLRVVLITGSDEEPVEDGTGAGA